MKLIPYIQAMVNGLLVGSLYSVIAMGLTIIFGVMRVINMAHGELIMLGMYVAFWVYTFLGMGQMAALLISLPLFLVLGAAIYGAVVNRVERRAGEMGTLLVTAGLSYLVANAAQLVWKADFRSLPSALTARSLFLGGISLNYSLLWAFLAAVLLTAVIALAIVPSNDMASIFVVWIPLVGLYFLSIGLSWLVYLRKNRKKKNDKA